MLPIFPTAILRFPPAHLEVILCARPVTAVLVQQKTGFDLLVAVIFAIPVNEDTLEFNKSNMVET